MFITGIACIEDKETIDIINKNIQQFSQVFCDYIEPWGLVDISNNPVLQQTCDKQRRLNVMDDLKTPVVQSTHHPMVQYHNKVWYKNWVTCEICGTWTDTLKEQATDKIMVKSFKGFAWFMCSTQYSQSFCKYFVEDIVDQVLANAFELMLSRNMVCGYWFDLCRTNFYQALETSDWYDAVYENNPESADVKEQNKNNNFYDELYAKEQLGAPFKILWFSDLNLDLNYVYESSIQCLDVACCHYNDKPKSDDQKAGLFGNKNCNMPLDGFVRMIDAINSMN